MLEKRLRDLRSEYNKTQSEIAEIVNTTRQSYAAYESGVKPPLDVLINLAEYYNVSLDYLVGISDIKAREYIDPLAAEFINQCLEIYYRQKKMIIAEYIKEQE